MEEEIRSLCQKHYADLSKVEVKPAEASETSAFLKTFCRGAPFQTHNKLLWASEARILDAFEKYYLRTYNLNTVSQYDRKYRASRADLMRVLTRAVLRFSDEAAPQTIVIVPAHLV